MPRDENVPPTPAPSARRSRGAPRPTDQDELPPHAFSVRRIRGPIAQTTEGERSSEEERSPSPAPSTLGRRPRELIEGALQQGPRKKVVYQDPLVGLGRHFGRTIHALCRIHAVINNGIRYEADLISEGLTPEDLDFDQRFELSIYQLLLGLSPKLRDTILSGKDEKIIGMADLLQKGANGARSDDTKSLKGAILDWITPKGQSLSPPLARNSKNERGFRHERTGALLCPTGLRWEDTEVKEKLRSGERLVPGDEWPIFIYNGYAYDPEDPTNGAFRSSLLVKAYKHIFTSPSSVDKEPKATRSGNARLHGMTAVTPASIAYVATQVRFALCSSSIFSRTDTVTDSETFYSSVLAYLHDPDEQEDVNELIQWWNRQIFPGQGPASRRSANKNSALARIKVKRAEKKRAALQASRGAAVNRSGE